MSEDLTTYEAILQRMLGRVSDDIDKREGSIIWDALSPAALELAQQYDIFKNLIKQAFVSSSSGEFLDLGAGDQGLTRAVSEDDESFRTRALYQKRNPEKGGNDSDYERWALQVPGVQWARSIDKARGLGTVDLVIAGDPAQLAGLVESVRAIVDLKKPSGVDVLVRPVNIVAADFVLSVSGITAEVAIAKATEYLTSIGVGGTAVLAILLSSLINAGATDAKILEPSENLSLGADSFLDPVVSVA